MIDLTPLDVRKKKGDFRRGMRGYDPDSVDQFLDHVADRLDELVRENLSLRERSTQMSQSIESYRERERAMNEALISAQQLREETRAQAGREAELTLREARAQAEHAVREARVEAERILDGARRQLAMVEEGLRRVQAQRHGYLRAFRGLLERHREEVEQEEARLRDLLQSGEGQADDAAEQPAWLAALDHPSTDKQG
jgi:DivIVA domain-containing protein